MSKNIEAVFLPPEGFVRLPRVLELLGIKKSKLWELIKDGKFPAPKKLGAKASVWDVRELREFMERLSREGSI